MKEKILTIGVPTYNRAIFLDKALGILLPQVQLYNSKIQVLISNNSSTDNTDDVIDKYKKKGYAFDYFRQPENLGPEGNFTYIYNSVKTKYLWLLSDDDILFPGAVSKIMSVLSTHDIGVLYLNNVWSNDESLTGESFDNSRLKFSVYHDSSKFIQRIHYWITFISANIINKRSVESIIDVGLFKGTYLQYLSWHVPAIKQNSCNVVIENPVLLCKPNNTGGYRLFEVFGKNFSEILSELKKRGFVSREDVRIIKSNLVSTFFPSFIGSSNKFIKELPMLALFFSFWSYRDYWMKILPLSLRMFLRKIYHAVF